MSGRTATSTPLAVTVSNAIPARVQWNANYGCCGEVSFIQSGMYYGQYVSQYDARALASPGVAQNLESSQLLIGVNDVATAARMLLAATAWTPQRSPDPAPFLAWVKGNVARGYPDVAGLYTNNYKFDGNPSPNAGNSEYDHIVTGMPSRATFTNPATCLAEDRITIEDHGIWADPGSTVPPTSSPSQPGHSRRHDNRQTLLPPPSIRSQAVRRTTASRLPVSLTRNASPCRSA